MVAPCGGVQRQRWWAPVWAFVLGCNSFPYLDHWQRLHCGDLVCGDRQQSYRSGCRFRPGQARPVQFRPQPQAGPFMCRLAVAVCSRRWPIAIPIAIAVAFAAAHSITIICLRGEVDWRLDWAEFEALASSYWLNFKLLNFLGRTQICGHLQRGCSVSKAKLCYSSDKLFVPAASASQRPKCLVQRPPCVPASYPRSLSLSLCAG